MLFTLAHSDYRGKPKMLEATQPAILSLEGSSSQPQGSRSPLEELLDTSKDAERLISCFFDLHAIEGEPFQGIWDRLAKAIQRAHCALRSSGLPLDKMGNGSSFLRRPM